VTPAEQKNFSLARALSIAKKEVRHIVRDPFTLTMALSMPVLLVTFFGFIIDFDVRNIKIYAVDRDQTKASRELKDLFTSAQLFDVIPAPETATPLQLLDEEKGKAVLIIEPGFQKKIKRGQTAHVQMGLDGADNQTAGIIAGYVAALQRAAVSLAGVKPNAPIELRTRFLFNPELNSHWFVIPGLAVVIVGILSILLTALTVAREWENGSMELLLSTPVRPFEIIAGKLAPYTALGLGSIIFVYWAARFVFGVPFRGNHGLFLLSSILFLGTALAQGLVISVVTRQQQIAMQMANMTGMLPSLMLSGFIFPIESMPVFFQRLTALLAPRWFMTANRGLFLKGAGLAELATPLTALLIINVVLLSLAAKKFKTDLEP